MEALVWMAVVAMLAVPAWHQCSGHRVHDKLLRAVTGSPEVPPTQHEINHAQRPMWLRVLANAGWLGYLAAVLALVRMR